MMVTGTRRIGGFAMSSERIVEQHSGFGKKRWLSVGKLLILQVSRRQLRSVSGLCRWGSARLYSAVATAVADCKNRRPCEGHGTNSNKIWPSEGWKGIGHVSTHLRQRPVCPR